MPYNGTGIHHRASCAGSFFLVRALAVGKFAQLARACLAGWGSGQSDWGVSPEGWGEGRLFSLLSASRVPTLCSLATGGSCGTYTAKQTTHTAPMPPRPSAADSLFPSGHNLAASPANMQSVHGFKTGHAEDWILSPPWTSEVDEVDD